MYILNTLLDLASNPITSFAVLSSVFFLFLQKSSKMENGLVLNQYMVWLYVWKQLFGVQNSIMKRDVLIII